MQIGPECIMAERDNPPSSWMSEREGLHSLRPEKILVLRSFRREIRTLMVHVGHASTNACTG